jgi:hypothetical protein
MASTNAFRILLNTVSQNLCDSDWKNIVAVYAMADILSYADKERITCATELFTKLLEKRLIHESNTNGLRQLITSYVVDQGTKDKLLGHVERYERDCLNTRTEKSFTKSQPINIPVALQNLERDSRKQEKDDTRLTFRQLLVKIAAGINDTNLGMMAFLVEVPTARKEKFKSAINFIDYLIEEGYLSEKNTETLESLLKSVKLDKFAYELKKHASSK